ncbi:hypothetical protein IAF11_09590, partial [Acinetobacter baumannii]|nr:hypothetical protein [Acinetobacter baumannii]
MKIPYDTSCFFMYTAKIHALRYAFLEMGVEDGVIVARTDSEGADLTQKI